MQEMESISNDTASLICTLRKWNHFYDSNISFPVSSFLALTLRSLLHSSSPASERKGD